VFWLAGAVASCGDGDDDGVAMEMKVEDGCYCWSRCVERRWCCEQVQGRRALVRASMVARWCSRWLETLMAARVAAAMVMEGDDEN